MAAAAPTATVTAATMPAAANMTSAVAASEAGTATPSTKAASAEPTPSAAAEKSEAAPEPKAAAIETWPMPAIGVEAAATELGLLDRRGHRAVQGGDDGKGRGRPSDRERTNAGDDECFEFHVTLSFVDQRTADLAPSAMPSR